MFPAARIGDPITHDMLVPCGAIAGPPTPPPVIIEMLPAAHVTHLVLCSGVITGGIVHPPTPPPGVPIVKGSLTVLSQGTPAARWVPSLDIAGCGVFLGDPKLAAMRRTLIGDVPAMSPGGGFGAFFAAAAAGSPAVCKGPCRNCGRS